MLLKVVSHLKCQTKLFFLWINFKFFSLASIFFSNFTTQKKFVTSWRKLSEFRQNFFSCFFIEKKKWFWNLRLECNKNIFFINQFQIFAIPLNFSVILRSRKNFRAEYKFLVLLQKKKEEISIVRDENCLNFDWFKCFSSRTHMYVEEIYFNDPRYESCETIPSFYIYIFVHIYVTDIYICVCVFVYIEMYIGV